MKSNKLNNAALAFTFIMIVIVIVSKLYSEDYDITSEKAAQIAAEEEGMSLQSLFSTLNSDKKGSYLFVDLREPGVFAHDHIEGAINIPFGELLTKSNKKTLKKSDKTIVFYGEDEVNSSNAWYLLRQLDYNNITFLHGGFTIARKHIINNYQPSYGHYKAEKPKFEFSKYFSKQEAPKKQEVEVETTIEVSGGC